MRNTFLATQRVLRQTLGSFFEDTANADRLHRLLEHAADNPELFEVLAYLVTGENRLVLANDGENLVDLKVAYRAYLGMHKKRFFDFLAVPGRGDLWFEDEHNPVFAPSARFPTDAAPLAVLNALRFVISSGADAVFWDDRERVVAGFRAFVEGKKRTYQESHRATHRRLREAAQKQVDSARLAAEQKAENEKRLKNGVKYTRQERRNIQAAMTLQRRQRREAAEKRRATGKKRVRKGKSDATVLRVANVAEPPPPPP